MRSLILLLASATAVHAFCTNKISFGIASTASSAGSSSRLSATEEKAAPLVSGEELERMLTEWDEPLVIDAYATW